MRLILLVFCFFACISTATMAQCPSDHAQLRDWYNNNNGASWNVNWNTPPQSINDVNMTGWEGITKDGNGCVTEIGYYDSAKMKSTLANKNISGAVPNFNLPKLVSLTLGYNQLSGNIPNFDKLPNLTRLNLGVNQLIGTIPNFNKLLNLTFLHLSNNQLNGNIPNFDKLPNLTNLELFNNQLNGNIPNFDKLSNLTNLSLSNNQLNGNIPNFDKLSNLRNLSLFNNQLNGNIPNFDKLPNLLDLSLHNNQLSGNIPNFGKLPNLTNLSLVNNQLSGNIPNFDKLPNLTFLSLVNNQLSGNIPNFDKLSKLTDLRFYDNQLSGNIPNFNKLPNLTYLLINNNQLSGNIPDFDQLPNLTFLSLVNNQLSGCFPNALKTKCGIIIGFSNNPKLPWQGDFKRFCKGEAQTGAPCDDGNPNTTDDKIDASCLCKGKLPIDTASCRYQDSLQLWNWFAANNNPNSPTWKVNWAKGLALDKWEGISLDPNGCVKTIQLNNKNLNGSLPNFGFSQLQGLYLLDNQLNGNIPNFNLINLQFLNLNNNKFSGSIPDFSLPKLQFLGLESNQLNGNVPNFNLIELKTLSISNNQLSGSIPNFNQLPKLSDLNLGNNKLIGIIPNFDKLPLLKDLGLGWNQLNGNIPNFDKLPLLKYLSLEINKLSGSIPNFDKIPKLVHLSLSDNLLNGNIPNFDKLPLIKELLLGQNQLSGTVPSFNKLPNLEMLHLYNNQFYGCYSDSLKRLCPLGVSINYSKGYRLSNNPRLPFQGDFQRFCNGENPTGAACDDGNPSTKDDKIDANCECKGTKNSNPCVTTVKIYDETICEGSQFLFDNKILTKTGSYSDTLKNKAGCDSIITLRLKILEKKNLILGADEFFLSPNTKDTLLYPLKNDKFTELIKVKITAQPDKGEVNFSLPDKFRYQNAAGFQSEDLFTYTVCYDACPNVCAVADVTLSSTTDPNDCVTKLGDKIYNGITPNGNDKNVYFDPLGDLIENNCPVDPDLAELRIIAPSGDAIFRAKPYQKWFGTREGTSDGTPVESGIYYYVLIVKNKDGKKEKIAKGKILILK